MIVVTGASGFVGRHLVRALAERFPGAEIRRFDLHPTSEKCPGEFISGGIEDRVAIAGALEGATVVVHLAAKVQPASRELNELSRINVEGARNVYTAAVNAGCRLFLHMSSAGVYGPPRKASPFQENDAPRPETPYQRTKFEAEEELRRIPAITMTLNILRPAGIYGPGSHLEIPSYKRIMRQRICVELRGGVVVHPTHVSDVVGAIVALIDRPAPTGSIFNIGGERSILHQDLQAMVANLLGVPRRRLVLPSAIARPATALAESVLRRLGRPMSPMHTFSKGDVLSSAVDDRAFRIRYPAVPVHSLEDGIRGHLEWARNHHLLEKPSTQEVGAGGE